MDTAAEHSPDGREPLLCVFAKAPRPGMVKTRLQTDCSAVQAARIAETLIAHTIACAHQYWPGPLQLCVWPDTDHRCFAELVARYDMDLVLQRGADLGERMYEALRAGIAAHGAAAILGSDVPQISGAVLEQARSALRARRNVIGPATDGGFYLVGSCTVHPHMFRGLRWSHNAALRDTVARCRSAGIVFEEELVPLCDIDTWDGLMEAAREVPELRRFTGGAR